MLRKYTVLSWKKVFGLCTLATFMWPATRFSYAEQPIPDWTAWECKKPVLSYDIIETHECHPPGELHNGCIILKLRGANIPFLIGWGRDELAENPGASASTALYKDGRWIVGVRGTGFTTEEKSTSISFYIFLTPDFSVREQIEIEIPESESTKALSKLEVPQTSQIPLAMDTLH